jgi:hypothetical protein
VVQRLINDDPKFCSLKAALLAPPPRLNPPAKAEGVYGLIQLSLIWQSPGRSIIQCGFRAEKVPKDFAKSFGAKGLLAKGKVAAR